MAESGDHRREEDDEGEEEELGESNYKTQKDAVLLAIHVSESMSEPPKTGTTKKGDKDSAVTAALKCAYHLMEQRIICCPKDMMGILLFGTEKTKANEGSSFPNCYVLADMDVPAAEEVRALKALAEDGDDEEGILKPAEVQSPKLLNRMLHAASNIFTTKAANFTSRRLFIVTDDDEPDMPKSEKNTVITLAKDLYDINVSIDLFPVSRGDTKFDLGKFYDDLIYRDPAEANLSEVRTSKSGDGRSLLSSLISNINSRQTAKRSVFSNLGFEIAPGLTISVNGYNVLHRQVPQKSCYVWLDGETPQLAVGETARVTEDSARALEKSEIKKAYKFGGEFIYFTAAEQKELKSFGNPVIRIVGFKPRGAIPVWAAVAKSIFVFPSEVGYVGSTRVFAALWQKLLRDDKVGIAWAVTRANAAPRLVAVVPSGENAGDESGTHYLPAGLWLCPLPFADDLRGMGERADRYMEASEDLKTKMRIIVQQLQLPRGMYNPTKYPNPSLQWHYKILQALALEEEIPETGDDPTMPKYKAIAKRVGGYIQDWEALLVKEASQSVMVSRTKREAGGDDDGDRPVKKSRAAASSKPDGASMSNAQVKAAVDDGSLGKMTVARLKDILTTRGLATSGKKQDLVQRLEEWAESS